MKRVPHDYRQPLGATAQGHRRPVQFWRSRLLFVAISLAFMALGVRTLYLQFRSQPYLAEQGDRAYLRTLPLPAMRGNIVDRNGVMLASSLPASAVAVAPRQLNVADPRLEDLARLLELTSEELHTRIRGAQSRYFYLRQQVDVDTSERIRALRIPGVVLEPQFQRVYPQGPVMAQLVGFTNFEHNGQEGLELAFDQYLNGRSGSRQVARDGIGRIIGAVSAVQEPRNGDDLHLSIDSRIQSQTYEALRRVGEETQANSASAVVVDTLTGQILALANWPSYDPNDRSGLNGSQLRNRAITDLYEPGSTIKPFTIAMGLASGKYKPETKVDVNGGRLTIGRRTITDTHKAKKPLTITEIIEESSNVGAAKIALSLPPEKLYAQLHAVGLGVAPDLGFPGAAAGVLRPAARWKPIEHATIAYGHGLSVSLLQMAHAYTALANHGRLVPLTLFRPGDDVRGGTIKVSLQSGPDRAVQGVEVMPPRVAAQVLGMMEGVVSSHGTAPEARIPGYRVGGKTGTTKKIENGRYVSRYVSSFVGIAPLSQPRIVVAVKVDEPRGKAQYGGQVAGPVFRSVASEALRILHVEPDAPFNSLIAPAASIKEGT